MENNNTLEGSILNWQQLATEQEEFAVYEESRGNYGQVARTRASLYRRTAEALRLELETGQVHCVCCLKTKCNVDNT